MAKADKADKARNEVVEHNEELAGSEDQNEALLRYKVTGVVGAYADPTRDQEPDISPALGEAPHPELGNPAPPAASFSGEALAVEQNPVLKSADDKEKDAEEATEAFNEAVQAREEWSQKQPFQGGAAAAQPVYVVDAPGEGDEAVTSLPPDESAKSRDGDSSAKA
jgi:hypothetical protein